MTGMKLLMLADPGSTHTVKWANSLSAKNIQVYLFGIGAFRKETYNNNIKIYSFNSPLFKNRKKIRYILSVPYLAKLIKEIKPDLIHAHYATSYGLLGGLINYHPYILSVWGSDIFDFPQKNQIAKRIIKYNLKRADTILSTSYIMANEIKKYTEKDIFITPFGIDTKIFKPMDVKNSIEKKSLYIGVIKTLEEHYGIEYLVRAFKIVYDKYPSISLKLMIVGDGSLKNSIVTMTKNLGIYDDCIFTGKIPYKEVPVYQNMLDICVVPSLRESFGVSVLEASSCEKPVIVTDIGGLPEVVKDGKTGFIIPPKDPVAIANKLEKLIVKKSLRINMGRSGRIFVQEKYEWDECVDIMLDIYKGYNK